MDLCYLYISFIYYILFISFVGDIFSIFAGGLKFNFYQGFQLFEWCSSILVIYPWIVDTWLSFKCFPNIGHYS